MFVQTLNFLYNWIGRSYVVGYGTNFPTQPRHEASSCPNKPAPCGWNDASKNKPNPQVLYGALVSGPNKEDGFEDIRISNATNSKYNLKYTEINIEYNAGFTGALAALLEQEVEKVFAIP